MNLKLPVKLIRDPCDNFYQFSCGSWIKAKKLKSENETNYYQSYANFNNFVKEVLDEKLNAESIAIKNIYHLITKSREFSNHRAENCNREILEFGIDNKNHSNVSQFTIKNFEEKSDCFVKQYRFQEENITDKHINSLNTLAKNIVDIGGLKAVHRAYMKYLQSIGNEEFNVSDFEDFISKQLFFFSFSRNFVRIN
uniref:Peptidase_M13 domain-containing protein n=1 Tax=Strongyloides venezuelensis TaxID=75913 RepID=A0A0K0FNG6_STRVS